MQSLFVSYDEEVQLPLYFLLDTDFLSALYDNKEFLESLSPKISAGSTYLIDPIIEFEFLRDNYLPSAIESKKNFINTLCEVVDQHPDISKQITPIAYNISKIMAHKGLAGVASYADFHIAARCFKYKGSAALITGNSRHYPQFLFERIGVINYQNHKNIKDQQMRVYTILKPNLENFEKCLEEIAKIKSS